MHSRIGMLVVTAVASTGVGLWWDAQDVAAADNRIVAVGSAVYEDGDGNQLPIDGAKVTVCDAGIIAECTVGITMPDGTFEVAFTDTLVIGSSTIQVRISAESVGARVAPDGILPDWYCMRSGLYTATDGETVDIGVMRPSASVTCDGKWPSEMDARYNAGFYVFTTLHQAYRTMQGLGTSIGLPNLPQVTARLLDAETAEPTDVSYYQPGWLVTAPTIMAQPYAWEVGTERSMEVLFHEYGHHLLYEMAESPPPDYDNDVCDTVDILLIFEIPDPGHCRWLPEKGSIAWTEGVPTFLAAALEHELYGTTNIAERTGSFRSGGADYWYQGTEFPAMEIVNRQTDVLWALGESEGLIEAHPRDSEREQIEGWTTAVLWDVYDADADAFLGSWSAVDDHDKDFARDTTSLSLRNIWRVITTYDPDPGDNDHNHPTDLFEFHAGVRALLPNTISAARLAGAYLENHFDVPAAAAELDLTGSYQTWNSNDVYHRGDELTARYRVCRPTGDNVAWAGDMTVGVYLVQAGTRFHTFEPLGLPDLAPGGCTEGDYVFTIPDELLLLGPVYAGGTFFDQTTVVQAHLCVDPLRVLAEHDEDDNCRTPHDLRLQNRAPEIVSNAGPDGYVVDEGSTLLVDLTDSYDPDALPGDSLRFMVFGNFGELGTVGDGLFSHEPVRVFTPADTPLLADGTSDEPLGDLRVQARERSSSEIHEADAVEFVPLTVRNVAPQMLVTGAPFGGWIVDEGSSIVVRGQFRDPGADDWEVSAYFGGGIGETSGEIVQTYYDDNILPAAWLSFFEVEQQFFDETSGKGLDFDVCVRDDDGGEDCTATGTLVVQVRNVAPTLDLAATIPVDEGSAASVTGSFADPGHDEWTGTVTIGGVTSEIVIDQDDQTFSIPVDTTDDGLVEARVCIDDGTDETCATTVIVVENVAPSVQVTAPEFFVEHTSDDVVGTFTDPGVDDTHTAVVAWGDGTISDLGSVTSPVTASHSYMTAGDTEVELCVSDGDGGTGCIVAVVEVLSAIDALGRVVDDLRAGADSDPAVAAAFVALDGAAPDSNDGALDKLNDGDAVAGLVGLLKAITYLEDSHDDRTADQRLLTLLAESVVRDLRAQVDDLGLTSRGALRQIDRIDLAIDQGRADYDAGQFAAAAGSYIDAARRASELLI